MLNFEIKIRLVRKATLRKGNFVDFKLEHWQIILKIRVNRILDETEHM